MFRIGLIRVMIGLNEKLLTLSNANEDMLMHKWVVSSFFMGKMDSDWLMVNDEWNLRVSIPRAVKRTQKETQNA